MEVCYIKVFFHKICCNFGILFVLSRTSLNRVSLNQGSTVIFISFLNLHLVQLVKFCICQLDSNVYLIPEVLMCCSRKYP